MRIFQSVLVGVSLLSAAVLAQAPPGAPPAQTGPPIFRAETESVEVDAIVTDKDGRFVRTLTKDDFDVYQDGKKQPLSLVTLVEHPIPTPQTAPATVEADPDVATN